MLIAACGKGDPGHLARKPAELSHITVDDAFWSPRLERTAGVTLPHALAQARSHGRMHNFALAAGLAEGEQQGVYPFDDSDIYKIIEGASYLLLRNPDPQLRKTLAGIIDTVAAAQEGDGYLFTARTNKAPWLERRAGLERWSRLSFSHELYNAGHLFEAAVAHFQATGERKLLDVAIKFADLLTRTFGEKGLQLPPGHQEVEIGLIRLAQTTGNEKYSALAAFFLEQRGVYHDGRESWGPYAQDHLPVREQSEAVGHAVRLGYQGIALADAATATGNRDYLAASNRLWHSVVSSKLYVTGGMGSVGLGERFAAPYDLPNLSAYQESCASMANAWWNFRLYQASGDARYVDVLERTLYNALLSGIALDGQHFFYPNALATRGYTERSEWFVCPCCVTNYVRFLPSLPGMAYTQRADTVSVNLFMQSRVNMLLPAGSFTLRQEGNYPWSGDINFSIEEAPQRPVALRIRIPGWAREEATPQKLYSFATPPSAGFSLTLNGEPVEAVPAWGFVELQRTWREGDRVSLTLDMPVRRVSAEPIVSQDRGKTALQRGPLMYCMEGADQPGGQVLNLYLEANQPIETRFEKDLLGGITTLHFTARSVSLFGNGLRSTRPVAATAIPYYAWAHRGRHPMTVWIPDGPQGCEPLNGAPLATRSEVLNSGGGPGRVLNQLYFPANSADQSGGVFRWEDPGNTVWVEYSFPEMQEISMAGVYWFVGEGASLPESWRILAWQDDQWQGVYNPSGAWEVVADRENVEYFETVRAQRFRLEVTPQAGTVPALLSWQID